MIFLSDGHDNVSYGARYRKAKYQFVREHNLVMKFNNIIEDYFKLRKVPYIRVNADYRLVDERFKFSSKVLSLRYKVSYINQLCEYFKTPIAIETHFNAGGGTGFEVLYYEKSKISKRLANLLITNLEDFLNFLHLKNRGAKPVKNKFFVKGTVCPALIIEPLFLDKDFNYYEDEKNFEMLAVAWGHAIEKIYRG